jgi:branched-chain amino acid transport system permease protein
MAIRSHHAGLLGFAAVAGILPFVFDGHLFFNVMNNIGLKALVCVGLSLLLGFAGQISLGHAGFFAIGAYASAMLTDRLGSAVLAALLGVLLCAVIAFIVGRSILRLKGHLLAMATLAIGAMIYTILNQGVDLFGGPDGIPVEPLSVMGHAASGEKVWYAVIWGALWLGILAAVNLVRSPIGRALRAIRGSETSAAVSGVDVARYKLLVFVISTVYASVAGSLYAHYAGFITPAEADIQYSFELLIMVLLGGMGSIYGVVLGAAILVGLPHLLTAFHDYETVLFGAILLATMMFMPKGLVPMLQRLFGRRA